MIQLTSDLSFIISVPATLGVWLMNTIYYDTGKDSAFIQTHLHAKLNSYVFIPLKRSYWEWKILVAPKLEYYEYYEYF